MTKKKIVDNYQPIPCHSTKIYSIISMSGIKKPKEREFQQWDQPAKLWGLPSIAKRERTWVFSLLLKSLPLELEKENEGIKIGSLSSSFISLYFFLLTILRRKDKTSKVEEELQNKYLPWLVWLSGLSAILWTKGSLVRFPVRAHAWVVGQVPSRGCTRGNHTLMFLILFLPSFLPL